MNAKLPSNFLLITENARISNEDSKPNNISGAHTVHVYKKKMNVFSGARIIKI